MKKTAEVMYKVAKIIAIILVPLFLGLTALFLILGIVEGLKEGGDPSHYFNQFARFLVLGILALVTLIVTSVQFKRMESNPDDKTPHIVCIVFGVLGENPFFIVGAILNIIMICQREDAASKPAEEKKEEVEAQPAVEEKAK